jgi:N-formylglutamate deformylase
MKKGKTILHIPYSSAVIPARYLSDYLLSEADLKAENSVMSDLFTDELFCHRLRPSAVFPYSRLFVDVERFKDRALEPMEARGMGALYTHGHRNQRIRQELDEARRDQIITEYYDAHHARLTSLVEETLNSRGQVLIIDCHSFPRERLPYELAEDRARPEICIGTDAFHTPDGLGKIAKAKFEDLGYSVETNFPFSGSLVPIQYYRKDSRVVSVMIEIRRDLYLDQDSWKRSENFLKVKSDIQVVMETLERSL